MCIRRKFATYASGCVIIVTPNFQFTTEDCNVSGTGQIATTATGWLWFDYDSKVGHELISIHFQI